MEPYWPIKTFVVVFEIYNVIIMNVVVGTKTVYVYRCVLAQTNNCINYEYEINRLSLLK